MTLAQRILKELKSKASPEKAKILMKFFRTGKGQYGEGAVFLGVTVPETRKVAKRHWKETTLEDSKALLCSKIHEERICALLILVEKFRKGDKGLKKLIFDFYIAHSEKANNWDLVDLSADKIAGEYLLSHPEKIGILFAFAKSSSLWKKRISIISTFAFIKKGNHLPTFQISEMLLHDRHDLIHKAVGWMLREIGKRAGQDVEEEFLKKHCKEMPRTMLRYAIERFPEKKRKIYLAT